MGSIAHRILRLSGQRDPARSFLRPTFWIWEVERQLTRHFHAWPRGGKLRRLARGLYDYPRVHSRLGPLAPAPDAVAQAFARETGSSLQVAGAHAANALGLSTQVPARSVLSI